METEPSRAASLRGPHGVGRETIVSSVPSSNANVRVYVLNTQRLMFLASWSELAPT